ncbi:MAG: hypothetical protein LBH80_03050 [Prevotellaceae bacterium]|jgi:hypothetical protein|nr:hypothetical protein [Prevotellaceae bacterium]
MKYKLVERRNPLKSAEPKKWYANPVNAGKFTVKDFASDHSIATPKNWNVQK